jgi:hypothetical protein
LRLLKTAGRWPALSHDCPTTVPQLGLLRARKVGVEQLCRFGFVAGHQVSVPVKGDLNRAMAEIGRERLCVYSGGDHQRGACVAALVQSDRLEPCCLPRPRSAPNDLAAIERLPSVSEEETARAVVAQPSRSEVAAQDCYDGDHAAAGAALRLDRAFAAIPGALDADQPGVEVDVLVAQRPELAEPEPGVTRRSGSSCSSPSSPRLGQSLRRAEPRFARSLPERGPDVGAPQWLCRLWGRPCVRTRTVVEPRHSATL